MIHTKSPSVDEVARQIALINGGRNRSLRDQLRHAKVSRQLARVDRSEVLRAYYRARRLAA